MNLTEFLKYGDKNNYYLFQNNNGEEELRCSNGLLFEVDEFGNELLFNELLDSGKMVSFKVKYDENHSLYIMYIYVIKTFEDSHQYEYDYLYNRYPIK